MVELVVTMLLQLMVSIDLSWDDDELQFLAWCESVEEFGLAHLVFNYVKDELLLLFKHAPFNGL